MAAEKKARWGIVGTGYVADLFARGLKSSEGAVLTAVGSRSMARAATFADTFGIPRRHASYEALVGDPQVDVVYLGVPHGLHREVCLAALKAGKAVLCEKPLAINATQAQEMVDCARRGGLFLMEAMWTRFLPVSARCREFLAEGAIGEPRMVIADFGFRADMDPRHRLFNPELGGGALLDVGVYPVALSSMVFGAPREIAVQASLCETGVDEQIAVTMKGSKGELSLLSAAIRTNTWQEAAIMGTKGMIKLHAPWWKGTKLTIAADGKRGETFELPYEGNGYNCEAQEVMRCLRAGQLESAVMPLDESLSIMRTLDRIRTCCGLSYPMER